MGAFWFVWVICPLCKCGRWVQENRTTMPNFTGRCKECYLKIAHREIGIYYHKDQE